MRSILIVEDEIDIAESIADLLTDAGYKTRTAANGKEALDRLGEELSDVVLTDLMMPIMGGRELLLALRADPRFRAIRFVIMTAGDGEEVGRALGAPVLKKPFKIDVLLGVLEDALST